MKAIDYFTVARSLLSSKLLALDHPSQFPLLAWICAMPPSMASCTTILQVFIAGVQDACLCMLPQRRNLNAGRQRERERKSTVSKRCTRQQKDALSRERVEARRKKIRHDRVYSMHFKHRGKTVDGILVLQTFIHLGEM